MQGSDGNERAISSMNDDAARTTQATVRRPGFNRSEQRQILLILGGMSGTILAAMLFLAWLDYQKRLGSAVRHAGGDVERAVYDGPRIYKYDRDKRRVRIRIGESRRVVEGPGWPIRWLAGDALSWTTTWHLAGLEAEKYCGGEAVPIFGKSFESILRFADYQCEVRIPDLLAFGKPRKHDEKIHHFMPMLQYWHSSDNSESQR